MPHFPFYDDPPYRLSGVVYGALLNPRSVLEQIGAAAHEPPYKAPPKGPVLYMKPRNTLAESGSQVDIPEQEESLRIGATVGLVIGRTACRVAPEHALDYLSGVMLVTDLTVPHETFYRPSVRFVARDGSCFLGTRIASGVDPDAVSIDVSIDGGAATQITMSDMVRPAARLLADVTDFMTLSAGDVLLLGTRIDGPLLRRGQRFMVSAEGLGQLEGHAR
ncbi:fumarylacetoacetate hydrolase family protein [Bordetella genomosp. 4]|uniref:fumarylacetoacetate hydrolase family protein n=1 Tax=Bordetella genomosp. 4 TaxID=463044 RepID=UPI000B9EC168|nr:fumarylacetoacetate hydrolase family protein [Bordetella genomosp. 4]OZI48656.1 2-hydroxyhepta-2,4-diene-1,7-dioate isomerase [Bordetella genomosp. 4]